MTSAPVADRYLSYAHAAEKLDLTVNALKQRVKRRTIPAWCYTRQLGSIRFIASALDEFMQPEDRAAVLAEVHPGRRHASQSPALRIAAKG